MLGKPNLGVDTGMTSLEMAIAIESFTGKRPQVKVFEASKGDLKTQLDSLVHTQNTLVQLSLKTSHRGAKRGYHSVTLAPEIKVGDVTIKAKPGHVIVLDSNSSVPTVWKIEELNLVGYEIIVFDLPRAGQRENLYQNWLSRNSGN